MIPAPEGALKTRFGPATSTSQLQQKFRTLNEVLHVLLGETPRGESARRTRLPSLATQALISSSNIL